MPYALCFLLFMIGLYCAVVKKNMVKIVIGILVMEYAVNLFLITGQIVAGFIASSVDPLPQALVLTAIVISLGSLALMISICIRTYSEYGTFDITEIRRLRG